MTTSVSTTTGRPGIPLPATMKAFHLTAPRKTELATVPVPATPEDGLLLKTRCVSICSTDISVFEGHLFPPQYPVVLGHEYLGEVVEIGSDFDNDSAGLEVGDRVVTTSGIYGQITKLNETSVQVQVADKVRVEIARHAIGGLQGQDPVVPEGGLNG